MAKDRRRGRRMLGAAAGFVVIACGLFMIVVWFTDPDRKGAPIGLTFVGAGVAIVAAAWAIDRRSAAAESAQSQPPARGDHA